MISKFKKRFYITLNNKTWDYLEKKSFLKFTNHGVTPPKISILK